MSELTVNDLLLLSLLLPIDKKILVEAAGVEPASEINVSREPPCSVCSEDSRLRLRTDKKPATLVR